MLDAQTRISGVLDDNLQQHQEFDEPLQSLRHCIEDIIATPTRFNADELRRRIEVLAVPLQKHLEDEIPTLLETGNRLEGDVIDNCYKAMYNEAEGTTETFK
jgi:hypothetical protein